MKNKIVKDDSDFPAVCYDCGIPLDNSDVEKLDKYLAEVMSRGGECYCLNCASKKER